MAEGLGVGRCTPTRASPTAGASRFGPADGDVAEAAGDAIGAEGSIAAMTRRRRSSINPSIRSAVDGSTNPCRSASASNPSAYARWSSSSDPIRSDGVRGGALLGAGRRTSCAGVTGPSGDGGTRRACSPKPTAAGRLGLVAIHARTPAPAPNARLASGVRCPPRTRPAAVPRVIRVLRPLTAEPSRGALSQVMVAGRRQIGQTGTTSSWVKRVPRYPMGTCGSRRRREWRQHPSGSTNVPSRMRPRRTMHSRIQPVTWRCRRAGTGRRPRHGTSVQSDGRTPSGQRAATSETSSRTSPMSSNARSR